MITVCPAVLARSDEEFDKQIRSVSQFAERVQIDLVDGKFTMSQTVPLDIVWWPKKIEVDIHLMYQKPMEKMKQLIHLRPNLVIIHAEADVHHMHFAAELHKEGIKAGLAILPETKISDVEDILHSFDHLLIFSGDLGKYGGQADLNLLEKVVEAKQQDAELEIGWDGGVNDRNINELVEGGIDVLNVGGFIQNSGDSRAAYDKLLSVVENRDGQKTHDQGT